MQSFTSKWEILHVGQFSDGPVASWYPLDSLPFSI